MSGAIKLEWPVDGLDLATEYGLSNPCLIEEQRSILRIRCANRDFAVKCNVTSAKERRFLTEILKFLQARQFTNYIGLLPTRSGEFFIQLQGKTYSLMNWLLGRECRFAELDDLLLYAQTLGKLHRATIGFGEGAGAWPKLWQEKLKQLKVLDLKYVSDSGRLRSLLPQIIAAGEKALALTQDPDVAWSLEQPAVVCHRDLTFRNVLITPEGQGYFIDFDMARPDTPARDLAQFLINALKKQNWQPNVALQIIRSYASEYPLARGDLGLALAFMYFPRSLWSLASRFERAQGQNHVALTGKAETVLARQPFLSTMCDLFDFKI